MSTQRLLWLRVGDGGEYESFANLEKAIEYLNALAVGKPINWLAISGVGFSTPNYHGNDFISCYWGDFAGNLLAVLSPAEKAAVSEGLQEAFI